MKFFLDNDKLIKGLSYGGLSFFFVLLQITLIPRYPIFGICPDIVLSCVLSIAMFEGARFGAVSGIVIGFVIDAVGSYGLSLSPFFYMIFGYITGLCSDYLFKRGWLSFSMSSAVAYFFRGFLTLINISAAWKQYSTGYVFLHILAPEVLFSFLFSFPVFFFFSLVAHRFHKSTDVDRPDI